ncbi:response regulator [Antarcticirhabdus aurantiaca]|uniref:Response regulator n=1 Tax=Antarcticirhabdus aurantiaca TaxID=2606717 RepID=A0ACD4NRV6_9HYPH|nr:response regulator [Antarcticirhabdus aurantiaca]WAJ29443.1 response regulator [Jeongeuplla avenae]
MTHDSMDQEPRNAFRPQPPSLRNKRVLVVEDDFFVAEETVRDFEDFGAEVVGPVSSLTLAFDVVLNGQAIDGAVLDINLLGERVFPLVDVLRRRGVPCVFATGYDRWTVPTDYQSVPLLQKPVVTAEVARALFG